MLCSKQGSDSNFSRLWQEVGESQKCPAALRYQLWQVHYRCQITAASPPCWARLAWWVLLCKGEHHLQERVAAEVLHSAGYGGPSIQMQSLYSVSAERVCISCELKITWDSVSSRQLSENLAWWRPKALLAADIACIFGEQHPWRQRLHGAVGIQYK